MSEAENRDLRATSLQSTSRLGIAAENLRMALVLTRGAGRTAKSSAELPGELATSSPIYVDQATELNEVLTELRELVARARDALEAEPPFYLGRVHTVAWSLGNVHRYAGSLSVAIGTLDRYFCEPVVPEFGSQLAHFFIGIPGLRDLLKRENHDHFGWHYHYCRKNRDRSDTILSFDAYSSSPEKPLLWEYHGEHKARFKARPYRWTAHTRENIYNSCKADVLNRPADQFRRPAKNAVLTWPPGPKPS